MRAPTGSIVGLCSASATMFAVGMAFLGYWGVYEQTPWRPQDIIVVTLAFVGFAALGSVTWIATTPVANDGDEKVVPARRAFAIGITLIWLAVLAAIVG